MAFQSWEDYKKKNAGNTGSQNQNSAGGQQSSGSAYQQRNVAYPSWEDFKQQRRAQSAGQNPTSAAKQNLQNLKTLVKNSERTAVERVRQEAVASRTEQSKSHTGHGGKIGMPDPDVTNLRTMTDDELAAETDRRKQQRGADRAKTWAVSLGTGGLYPAALALQELGRRLGISEQAWDNSDSDKPTGGVLDNMPNLYRQSEQSDRAYQAAKDALAERRAASYQAITQEPDFADRSQYNKAYRDDMSYRYINQIADHRGTPADNYDDDGTREAALYKGIFKDQNYQNVAQMTDEERAVYNYLYDPEDPSKSLAYVESIMPELNRRNMALIEQQTYDAARKDGGSAALESVRSVLETPTRAITAAEMIGDYIANDDIDTNQWYFQANRKRAAATQATMDSITEATKNLTGNEKVNKVADRVFSMLYKAGMSTGENLVNMGITGGNETATLALMCAEAAGDEFANAKARGFSDDRAMHTALISAGIEYLTEKIGLDVIMDKALPKESIINYMAKSFGAESGEEMLGGGLGLIVDEALDYIYNTEKSELQTAIKAYESGGMQHENAIKQTLLDKSKDILEEGIIGGISGVGMAGPTAFMTAAGNYRSAQRTGAAINRDAAARQQLIKNALQNADHSTRAYQLAAELQQQNNAGKPIADKKLGELYNEMQKASAADEDARELMARAAEEMENRGSASKQTIREIAQNPVAYHQIELKQDPIGQGDNLSARQRRAAIDKALRSITTDTDTEAGGMTADAAREQITGRSSEITDRYLDRRASEIVRQNPETAADRAFSPREGVYFDPMRNRARTGNQSSANQKGENRPAQEATPRVMTPHSTVKSGSPQDATFDGDRVKVTGIDHITDDGQVAVTLEDGRAVYLEDLDVHDVNAAQIYDLSGTLGNENAARTFISYYTGGDPIVYSTGFMSIYNAARAGASQQAAVKNSLYASELSATQQQAAFYAGQNAAKADQENQNQKENSNGTESGDVSVRGSSERNDRARAGERAGGVAAWTGEAQEQGSGSNQSSERLGRAIEETRVRGFQFTAATEGITGGVASSEARIVPHDVIQSTPELRQIYDDAKKNGIRLHLYTGTLAVQRNGRQFNVRGIHKGNEVYVKIDGRYGVDQIYRHEYVHHMIENDPSMLENMVGLLRAQMTEEQFNSVVQSYAQAHFADASGNILESENYILEEMLADVYGQLNGMDQQNQDASTRTFAAIAHDTLQSVAEIAAENRALSTSDLTKFSFEEIAENGKFVFKSNYPKGTPSAVKADHLVRLVQDVWSKKPITLTIWERDGSTRKIQAKFDPTMGDRTDLAKIAFGNRKGSGLYRRITLDLADDLYFIAETSSFNRSENAEPKTNNPTHDGVTAFHYFVNDVYYEDYETENRTLVRIVIDVKEKAGGNYFYSFHAASKEEIKLLSEKNKNHPTGFKSAVADVSIDDDSYTNNMPQNSDFVNRENQGNTGQVKFSLDDIADADVERLQRDNEQLTKTVEHLASQFKLVRGFHASDAMLNQLVRSTLKEYKSTYNAETLQKNLRTLFDYLADAETPSWDEIQKMGVGMAKEIVKQSQQMDRELYDTYEDARTFLRKNRIVLTDVQRGEARYMSGSYGNYRSRLFGSVNIVNEDGMSLDQAWQRLSEMNPELFDPNASEGDQVAGLYDAVQQMKPQYINPYGMDIDGVAYDLFLHLFDQYFDMPDVKKAAKDAGELAKMQVKTKQQLAMNRDEMKRAYDRRLLDLRKESIAQRQRAGKLWQAAKDRGDTEAANRYMNEFHRLQEKYSEKLLRQRAAYSVLSEYKAADRAQRIQHEQLIKYRSRVESGAKQLSKWLQTPTEQRHVPEVMRNTVYNFLQSLDFSGKSEVRTAYWINNLNAVEKYMRRADAANVANEESEQVYLDIDPDFSEQVEKLVESVHGDVSISDLSVEQLKQLNDIIDKLKTACQNVNTIIVDGRRQAIETFAAGAIQKAESAGYSENNPFINSEFGGLLTAGNIKPIYFFRHLGGPLQQLYNEFREGQRTYAFNWKKAQNFLEDAKEKYHVKSWLNKPGDVLKLRTHTGQQFELTRDEALSLYAIHNREVANAETTAASHLSRGGFVFTREVDISYDKNGKTKDARIRDKTPKPINAKDMAEIIKWLTPEQRAYADALVGYMSKDMAALGNEISMKTIGVKKFVEPCYFPYKTDTEFKATKIGRTSDESNRIMSKGFTKQTVAFANNPIALEGFTEVVKKHCNDMITYNAMAIPQENLLRVFNFKTQVDSLGETPSTSVKAALNNAYGRHAADYIATFLRDVGGDITADPRDQLGSKLTSKFKRAAVMANLSVIIQQPSAIVRAVAVINPKYFVGKPKLNSFKEAQKYSGTAIIKEIGGFDTGTGRGGANKLMEVKSAKITDQALDFIDKWGGFGAEKMDELTWGAIWEACKRETADKTNLKGEELLEAAGRRFDDVIDLTQVYDSVLSRSQLMRSPSLGAQMATSFMSEPTVTYNMLYDMLTNTDSKTKLHAARTIAAVVSATIFNTLLKSIVYAMRDKDDQPLLEKYVEAVVGSLAGERIEKWGPLGVVGHLLTSELSPVTMIPYVKDIVSLVQGYDVSRTDMSVFADLVKAVNNLSNENKTWPDRLLGLAEAIANMYGIPAKNVRRDIMAIFNTTVDLITNDQSVDPEGMLAAVFAGMQIDHTIKSNTEDAYIAYMKGNTDKAASHAKAIEKFYEDKVNKNLKKGETQAEAKKKARSSVNTAVSEVLAEKYEAAKTPEERAKIRALASTITVGNVPTWINEAPHIAARALYNASEAGNQTALQNALNELKALYNDRVKYYIRTGLSNKEAAKQARSDILGNCTDILKPHYKEASSAAEKVKIKQLALRITTPNGQLYSDYNFDIRWK